MIGKIIAWMHVRMGRRKSLKQHYILFNPKLNVLHSFDWDQGKLEALDLSPLNANILKEVGMTAGAAAQAAEVRKHTANGQRCTNLG